MGERMPSIHPGEILAEEFLAPLGLTPYRLARSLRVPPTRVAAILAGKRAITADTALRLARFFGNSPEFWLNLQATYELQEARRQGVDAEIREIVPLEPAA